MDMIPILDETDCISHSTNTLGKGMNPIILPPWVNSRTDWILQPWWGQNSEFKPVKLRLKNWPRVISFPSGGVGKYAHMYVYILRPKNLGKLFISLKTPWNEVFLDLDKKIKFWYLQFICFYSEKIYHHPTMKNITLQLHILFSNWFWE